VFVPVMAEASSSAPAEGIVVVEIGGAVVRIGQGARSDLAVAILQALRTEQ
jgi:transposase